MKRYLVIILVFFSISVSGQIINFAKTLPIGAYSLGTAVAYNTDTYVSDGGLGIYLFGGYGVNYSLDVNLRYGYFAGADYFGADLQYLFKESRKSYFTFIGGMHFQEDFWVDVTGSYTYSPQYNFSFTAGLDAELGFTDPLWLRIWIPLNAGININDFLYLFFEYSLPANGKAWDIVSLGANFIFR